MWGWPLPNCVPWEIPRGGHPGAFGFPRKHERHFGVDLYAPEGHPVHTVEPCKIIRIIPFTGYHADSPWWRTTWAILAEGPSGIIVYGEIEALDGLTTGTVLERGSLIGHVIPVLYEDKGNGTTMLHLELWAPDRDLDPQDWALDSPQPEGLRDPTTLLIKAWSQVTPRFHKDGERSPTCPKERQKLVQFLKQHPLWQHPTTIRVPSGFPDVTDVTLFGPEMENWEDLTVQVGSLQELLEVDYTYVDPTTERREEEDESRNTDFRVWLKAGGWWDSAETLPAMKRHPDRWGKSSDMDLDCGAATLEEALIQLALRVQFYYCTNGTRKEDSPPLCSGDFTCQDAGDGFCQFCGYLICAHNG